MADTIVGTELARREASDWSRSGARFGFELPRLTVVVGDVGRGKTTLVDVLIAGRRAVPWGAAAAPGSVVVVDPAETVSSWPDAPEPRAWDNPLPPYPDAGALVRFLDTAPAATRLVVVDPVSCRAGQPVFRWTLTGSAEEATTELDELLRRVDALYVFGLRTGSCGCGERLLGDGWWSPNLGELVGALGTGQCLVRRDGRLSVVQVIPSAPSWPGSGHRANACGPGQQVLAPKGAAVGAVAPS